MSNNIISLCEYRAAKEAEEYDVLKNAVDNIIKDLGPSLNSNYFVTDVPKGTFPYSDTGDPHFNNSVSLQQQYIFCVDVLEHVSSTLLDLNNIELSNEADNLLTRVMVALKKLCKEQNN